MKKILVLPLIAIIFITACSSNAIVENQMGNVKLTAADLPAGFLEKKDSFFDTSLVSTILQKGFLNSAPTGKILNTSAFVKDAKEASYGILSFEYLLSDTEKSFIITETKKQDVATCCKLLVQILQVEDQTTCQKPGFTSLIKVYPELNNIGEGSLGCDLNAPGTGVFDLGYSFNRNALSFILDGFTLTDQTATVSTLIDLKTLLTAMDTKVKALAK